MRLLKTTSFSLLSSVWCTVIFGQSPQLGNVRMRENASGTFASRSGEVHAASWTIPRKVNTVPVPDLMLATDIEIAPQDKTATLTGGKPASESNIKFTAFDVQSQVGVVRIDWSTVFEKPAGRFEIQRSTDGITWSIITVIKGAGSANAAEKYNIYDLEPFSGINYYAVKQVDFAGRSTLSPVKWVNLTGNPDIPVSVNPYPIVSGVHFSLERKPPAIVLAKLMNAKGKVIHTETIKNIQSNTQYTLNMKLNPAPGVYVLHLKAVGLSKKMKVIIE